MMKKRKKHVHKFFEEFKQFIARGNVLDLAVGVIVGGAFTGIVNGISNFLLKPFINFLLSIILKGEGLASVVTPLTDKAWVIAEDGTKTLDLSLCLQWGELISTVIEFMLIAFVLFSIVRIINNINAARDRAEDEIAGRHALKKKIREIKKAERVTTSEAEEIYEKRVAAAAEAKAAAAAAEAAKKAAEEAAAAKAAEEKAMANTVLLQEILAVLKSKE